ncbi:hypothetical protein A1F95_10494 [Pyrenophora tritici-repentis]|nr:hypothetical protein A1F95_10494 [Pyrenophora tritici-repentis]
MSTSKSSWLDSYRLQITDHSLGRATVHEPLYCLSEDVQTTTIAETSIDSAPEDAMAMADVAATEEDVLVSEAPVTADHQTQATGSTAIAIFLLEARWRMCRKDDEVSIFSESDSLNGEAIDEVAPSSGAYSRLPITGNLSALNFNAIVVDHGMSDIVQIDIANSKTAGS